MPLIVSKDSYDAQQVTLSGIVALCEDCAKYCLEKTERIMSNRSRAPRGWEKEYLEVAEARRIEDMDLCMNACKLVPRSCPSVSRIQQVEAADGVSVKSSQTSQPQSSSGGLLGRFFDKSKTEEQMKQDMPTIEEMSRCENAAERFTKVLFAITQKPSKIHFESINPKTGEKMAEGQEEVPAGVIAPPTSAPQGSSGKRPADKQAMHDEILRRWSTSRRERINMEELGVIRTEHETNQLKQSMIRDQQKKLVEEADQKLKDAAGASSGTVPKW